MFVINILVSGFSKWIGGIRFKQRLARVPRSRALDWSRQFSSYRAILDVLLLFERNFRRPLWQIRPSWHGQECLRTGLFNCQQIPRAQSFLQLWVPARADSFNRLEESQAVTPRRPCNKFWLRFGSWNRRNKLSTFWNFRMQLSSSWSPHRRPSRSIRLLPS